MYHVKKLMPVPPSPPGPVFSESEAGEMLDIHNP